MRRHLASGALALGLVALVASPTAGALPGLDDVSVNRGPAAVNRDPVSVNRPPVSTARRAVPGADQRDPRAHRRRQEQRRRARIVARWQGVADCESGGNWRTNTGNGYYGGLQFSLSTWRAYGGRGRPDQEAPWYQASIADRVRTQSGLHHWPHCGQHYRG